MTQQGFGAADSPYKDIYDRLKERVESNEPSGDPMEVARAALHAMFDPDPKRRYLVVPNQEQAMWTIGKAVEEQVQLNMDHDFSYSREQLIEMLDKSMNPPAAEEGAE